MIQFNLLPDIKQEYIRAQKTRRLITAISSVVTIAAIAVLVVMFLFVDVWQKKHLSDLSNDVKQKSSTLKDIPNINKILTIQNQLDSLTGLHEQKPAAKRLFKYLEQVTPAQADITDLSLDFSQGTMSITGTADSLKTVNKFVDTLKFTKYKVGNDDTQGNAFSDVVLSEFGRSASGSSSDDNRASYAITLSYDSTIFDITQDAKLVVPNIVTTRSMLGSTDALFKEAPKSTEDGN